MTRRLALLLAIGALGAAAGVANAGTGGETRSLSGNFTLRQVRAFDGFPLYSLGESWAGLPLTGVYRIDDQPYRGERVRRDDVTFVYGSCAPRPGEGCLPPLQVQSWTSCERNPRLYAIRAERAERIAGRPARFYEAGRRLELSAGATTVVIYAIDPRLLRRAAASLRVANTSRAVRTCRRTR